MSISQRARTIAGSPPNEEAQLLRQRGEAVTRKIVGEPENKAPISKITSGEVVTPQPDLRKTDPTRKDLQVVGHVTPRKDGVARVTGQELYTVDMILPRMLYGRIVSSP